MRPIALYSLFLLTLGLLPQPVLAQGIPTGTGQSAGVNAPTTALPKVRLVATGGTISNRNGGRLTAEELVASMPGLDRYVRPEAEQFSNTSSGALTLKQWLDLARRINTLFKEEPDLAGVVVTSGTDTLEETAYFLDLTVRSEKPVVVVGSMRNPSTLGYEGAANLLEGFRVAASPDARGKGVLVVLNDEINAARDVTKTDALRLNTFQSRGYGLLGVVDSDRVVFYRSLVKRHTAASEFDVSGIDELPRVDVVMVYQGASGDIIKAIVGSGRARDRDRIGRRGRDQRHAGSGHPVRDREGRVRGDEHTDGLRPNRSARPRNRRDHNNVKRRRRRSRTCAASVGSANRRGRSRAGQGADPPDAGADTDDGWQRDPADVHRYLI